MTKLEQIEAAAGQAWDDLAEGTARTVRGAVAGMIGGVIASWAMNRYQQIESRPVNVRRAEAEAVATSPSPELKTDTPEPGAEGDNATVKTAQRISTRLLKHDLSPCEKKIAGPVVHYGYGAAVGALYGGLAELVPTVGIGLGVPYATILFLAGDEIAVPALGLSKPPTSVPPARHVSALATHFVYGITLDISRRVLRRLI